MATGRSTRGIPASWRQTLVLTLGILCVPGMACVSESQPAIDSGVADRAVATDDGSRKDVNPTSDAKQISDAGSSSHRPAGGGWITGYYIAYAAGWLVPSAIDYTQLSHLIHFSIAASKTPPYYSFPDGQAKVEGVQAELIQRAHAKGVRVYLSLLAGSSDVMPTLLTNSPDAFVQSLLGYAKSKGYDGVDIDWEAPSTAQRSLYKDLLTRLRKGLDAWSPRGDLATAVLCVNPALVGYDIAAMNQHVDQVNLMCYNLDASSETKHTGHNSPLQAGYCPSCSGCSPNSVQAGVTSWVGAGLDPKKLGVGMPFYAWDWVGNTTLCESAPSPSLTMLTYGEALGLKSQLTQSWDNVAKAPWLGGADKNGTKHFVSYDDVQSITAKVQYAKGAGVGGVMLYCLHCSIVDQTLALPLLEAASKSYWGW